MINILNIIGAVLGYNVEDDHIYLFFNESLQVSKS